MITRVRGTHIGFTGTRVGLTKEQSAALSKFLFDMFKERFTVFHHGDCIGSDVHARNLAKEIGYKIEQHPPIKGIYRAFCADDVIHKAKDYMARNRDIVNAASIMLATPGTMYEQSRSGTWATIRYARKTNTMCWVVFPDGTTKCENWIG